MYYTYEELQELLRTKQKELDEAIEREAALATHVERLRKAALDAIHYLPGGEIKAELRDAYDDTPETSLAHRDLIKQAEVFFTASDLIRHEYDGLYDASSIEDYFYEKGKDIHQQAKEL